MGGAVGVGGADRGGVVRSAAGNCAGMTTTPDPAVESNPAPESTESQDVQDRRKEAVDRAEKLQSQMNQAGQSQSVPPQTSQQDQDDELQP